MSPNSYLGRLNNVLDEDDGLEGGEQAVDPGAGVLDSARQLGLGDLDVNVQECLVGKIRVTFQIAKLSAFLSEQMIAVKAAFFVPFPFQ